MIQEVKSPKVTGSSRVLLCLAIWRSSFLDNCSVLADQFPTQIRGDSVQETERNSLYNFIQGAPMGIGGKHFKIYYRHKGGKFHNHSSIPCQHSAKKHVLLELLQSRSLSGGAIFTSASLVPKSGVLDLVEKHKQLPWISK